MGEKVRVGVIGTGMMGVEHINNLLLMPDVTITALADPSADMAARAAALLGPRQRDVKVFDSSSALLASGSGRCHHHRFAQSHPWRCPQ